VNECAATTAPTRSFRKPSFSMSKARKAGARSRRGMSSHGRPRVLVVVMLHGHVLGLDQTRLYAVLM
jgi:hypothetical protein